MALKLYNTKNRVLEDFVPLDPSGKMVTMYNCGPTVYNYAHIGNLRAYVFADVLRRTLEASGYAVKQVINITDVGHLVSDADEGEDKMEVARKREGKSAEEIIATYSNAFYEDLAALNIEAAAERGNEAHFPRATHHIEEQKELVEVIAKKGYAYTTSDGIYFDTAKFPRYAEFARLDIAGLQGGARVGLGEKKNITDFALWKFSPKDGQKREQEWDNPLGVSGRGFPGWHIECSAMSRKYLGQPFDIHTGGIDHIPVHHTNEIAQSEAAYDLPLARYWMHSAHMTVNGEKMSKSLGNTYRLFDLIAKDISPLAFRYWLLTANYRTTVNFTWEALEATRSRLLRLHSKIGSWGAKAGRTIKVYEDRFYQYINDDLNTPRVVSLLDELVDDTQISGEDKRATALKFDQVLGLKLHEVPMPEILYISLPDEVKALLAHREQARKAKNFADSDRLRDEIKKLGYEVKDTPGGQEISRM